MRKSFIVDQTILAQIQPLCDAFRQKVNDEKKRQSKTNQDIADWTGVPISNINKFFSGSLSNPCVFYAAAVCIYLGISIDDAFGIQPNDNPDPNKLLQLEHDLKNAEKIERINEDVIFNLRKNYRVSRIINICLMLLCIIQLTALVVYLYIDSGVYDAGLIIHGKLTLLGTVEVIVVLAAVVVITNIVFHFAKKKTEKDDFNVK